ncbi:unnamed protein product [Parascedosporium putredinis]|uniref:RNA helicase n=1 Tax=Parascedosporium putredinis TaxID=1442378 RepID=A0A9P1MBI1_9PEZI|nr:unnamed protein product [Parascedosporium putredinis]CAI7998701.1 unnamed protein product [Parascedosporium putredinis]
MAKKFVPRQRKHKVLARQRAQENATHEVDDANALEIIPAQKRELEERKAKIKEELKAEGSKVDTTLFSSTKALGQGKETKKQSLRRALLEERAGIQDESRQDLLFQKRNFAPVPAATEEDEESSGTSDEDEEVEDAEEVPNAALTKLSVSKPIDTSSHETSTPLTQPLQAGSGLKRPLDVDDEGRPVLKKRQKRGGVVTKVSLIHPERQITHEDDYEEWGGFSGNSEQDGSSEEEDLLDDDEGEDSGESEGDEEDDSVENADSSDEENTHGDSDGEEDEDSDEDDEDDDDDAMDEDDDEAESRKARSSAFKAWAHQQRNEALGYAPVSATPSVYEIPKPENFTPRGPESDPLPKELLPTQDTERKAFAVAVKRSPEIQEARLKLPVVGEEQRIMEAIHNNDTVVICGSTGSGKTTQIPQFLFEAGYGAPNSPTSGMIGITQPRRVAAVSMSKRVAQELGEHSKRVAYQIRFEGTADPTTAIKFMTDGVLLREVAQDISLRKYSAIIVDEAHERSVNTDILIGILSRVIKLRREMAADDPTIKPLKLIIMSATLRVDDMTQNQALFAIPPPVVEVEGRQHPVTVHFARRTQADYVEEAFKKLSKRLKAVFCKGQTSSLPNVKISASEAPMEVEDVDFGDVDDRNDDGAYLSEPESDEGDEDEEDEFEIDEDDTEPPPLKMQILPLYSLLPTREQLRVFEEPPEGTRQVIIATNVAETSLTIPGTRYVFDCGRAKERQYDKLSGVQSYDIGWISKASANQRSGRAGRTGPGHCYRLYSSAVYERDLQQFTDPELLRMPIEGVVLQLKAMNLQHVVNFPFPTPPDRQSLAKGEKLLEYLSALSPSGAVTQVGKTMSMFPLSPRFSRILLVGHQQGCLPYTIALIAALSVAEIFIPENQAVPSLAEKGDDEILTAADVAAEDRQVAIRRKYNAVHANFCSLDGKSDAIKLLQVVGEFAHDPTEEWCETHFVRFKVLKEIQQLRRQIVDLLKANIASCATLKFEDQLSRPTEKQIIALKEMVAAGFIDQGDSKDPADSLVYIHPSSPLAHHSTQECPPFIIYAYLQRASTGGLDLDRKPKTRMHALTDISGRELAALAKGTPLISYGKPIKETQLPKADDGRGWKPPPYAALSHTWGSDEITYKDMAWLQEYRRLYETPTEPPATNGESSAPPPPAEADPEKEEECPEYTEAAETSTEEQTTARELRARNGYRKILNAAEHTRASQIGYLWIDTCCVDRSSSADASEAVLAAHRLFKNSAICFIYLADVPADDAIADRDSGVVRPVLELYFPDSLLLAEITGIDFTFVEGADYGTIPCVAKRLSWAAHRSATRPEDVAYCLMGLFNIAMPVLYGEGQQSAFLRLQHKILKKTADPSIFAWGYECLILSDGQRTFAVQPRNVPFEYFVLFPEILDDRNLQDAIVLPVGTYHLPPTRYSFTSGGFISFGHSPDASRPVTIFLRFEQSGAFRDAFGPDRRRFVVILQYDPIVSRAKDIAVADLTARVIDCTSAPLLSFIDEFYNSPKRADRALWARFPWEADIGDSRICASFNMNGDGRENAFELRQVK